MRNKIGQNKFISLADLTAAGPSNDNIGRQIEMNSREYLAENVPPLPKVQIKH